MTSLRGKLAQRFISRHFNMNSAHTSDSVASLRSRTAYFRNDKTPKGFSLIKETTPRGTSYERLLKNTSADHPSYSDTPPGERRVVYYLHGGAYVLGLLSLYRMLAESFYQAAGGCEIILLDYRCAPEYQYPTQLEEALDVWEELTERQGYQAKQIVVGGDSAGGNLTLAMLLRLRDAGKALPRAAFCISPWADMTGNGKSFQENYGKDVMFGDPGETLTKERKERLLNGRLYSFVGAADRYDPYVSPVYGDYRGFPPMYFTAGGNEMLLSDTLTIVEKLKQCGVPVGCDIQPGMFHIYALAARLVPEGTASFRKILAFIRRSFRD